MQKQLGGMHPSEFLLSEFIYRNRAELKRRIKQGKPALHLSKFALTSATGDMTIKKLVELYKPLLDRFFGKYNEKILGWPLNLKKKRVKAILGL